MNVEPTDDNNATTHSTSQQEPSSINDEIWPDPAMIYFPLDLLRAGWRLLRAGWRMIAKANTPQRFVVGIWVPAVLIVGVFMLEFDRSYRADWSAHEHAWVWLVVILAIGVFEWFWWSDKRLYPKDKTI